MSKKLPDYMDNSSFYCLDEPVALYFSYVDTDQYDFYTKNKFELAGLRSFHQQDLIDYLRQDGYMAVSDDNPLAAHPATIVVSKSGIQMPFIEPEKAKDFAFKIRKYVQESGFVKPLSHIYAVKFEQLSQPVIDENPNRAHKPDYQRHPIQALRDYIIHINGKSFIRDMWQKAWRNAEDTQNKKHRAFNKDNPHEPLYSGRRFAVEPFYIHARNDTEGRYCIFATLNYQDAARYCGFKESDRKSYGFIHHYQKHKNQKYYPDFGHELNEPSETDVSKQVETIVAPTANPHLGTELYMGKRAYMMPNDEEMWAVFMEYHRTAYHPNNENMKKRRFNILFEAKDNGGFPKTYMPIGLDFARLLLDEYPKEIQSLEDVEKTKFHIAQQHFAQYRQTIQQIKNPQIKGKEKPIIKDSFHNNNFFQK